MTRTFEYTPFPLDAQGTIDERVYETFLMHRHIPKQVGALVIAPVESAILKHKGFSADDINIGIKVSSPTTSWSRVYYHLLYYMDIREGDSREQGRRKFLKLVSYKPGIGHTIRADALIGEIDDLIDHSIDYDVEKKPDWPTRTQYEQSATTLTVPKIDFSKLSRKTVLAAMCARGFVAGFDKVVMEAYKEANKRWFTNKTGFDNKKNLPPPERGYIVEERPIGKLGLITIRLIRQEQRNYRGLIERVRDDLEEIQRGERGELWQLYRPDEAGDSSVNISRVRQRLAALFNDPEFVSTYARFEIVP